MAGAAIAVLADLDAIALPPVIARDAATDIAAHGATSVTFTERLSMRPFSMAKPP